MFRRKAPPPPPDETGRGREPRRGRRQRRKARGGFHVSRPVLLLAFIGAAAVLFLVFRFLIIPLLVALA